MLKCKMREVNSVLIDGQKLLNRKPWKRREINEPDHRVPSQGVLSVGMWNVCGVEIDSHRHGMSRRLDKRRMWLFGSSLVLPVTQQS